MFLLVTDVIWELAEKNHERQVKIIAPYCTVYTPQFAQLDMAERHFRTEKVVHGR